MLDEKEPNLDKEVCRHWQEICTHKYRFDRLDIEKEVLSKITLNDIVEHFNETFTSENSRRLDLELVCQAHLEAQDDDNLKNNEHQLSKRIKR